MVSQYHDAPNEGELQGWRWIQVDESNGGWDFLALEVRIILYIGHLLYDQQLGTSGYAFCYPHMLKY